MMKDYIDKSQNTISATQTNLLENRFCQVNSGGITISPKAVILVHTTNVQSNLCVSEDNLIRTIECYKFNTVNGTYIIH